MTKDCLQACRLTTTVVTALLVGQVTQTPAAELDVRDERRVTRAVSFAGGGPRTVDVQIGNGSLRVLGDDGTDVRVESVERYEADTRSDLDRAKERVVLETTAQGSTVEVALREGGWTGCHDSGRRPDAWWDRRRYDLRVELTVRVPRDVRVRACGVNGRLLSVSDTTGDFDITHVNGLVQLERLRGAGRVTTVNGDVDASFAAVPTAASAFKTVNGALRITYPESLAATLRLKTLHGDLLTDFETTAVVARADDADRPAWGRRLNRRPTAFSTFRVGAGGPDLTFETLNGDVRILKGARP